MCIEPMTNAVVLPTAIKLDPDIKAGIKRPADSRSRASHWLMREALVQYVDREEKREVIRQDAIKAWEDYQSTGLHVTAKEADDWLAQLEAGHDTPPPMPHA